MQFLILDYAIMRSWGNMEICISDNNGDDVKMTDSNFSSMIRSSNYSCI